MLRMVSLIFILLSSSGHQRGLGGVWTEGGCWEERETKLLRSVKKEGINPCLPRAQLTFWDCWVAAFLCLPPVTSETSGVKISESVKFGGICSCVLFYFSKMHWMSQDENPNTYEVCYSYHGMFISRLFQSHSNGKGKRKCNFGKANGAY